MKGVLVKNAGIVPVCFVPVSGDVLHLGYYDEDKGAMDAQAFLQVVERVDACHGSDTLRLAVSESSVW